MPTNLVLHYPNLIYERRLHPHSQLQVENGQSTGFCCSGLSCRLKPIHSSKYYNPRHQPNKPLIGIKCPFQGGSIRTYNRLNFIQDIRTLNHATHPSSDKPANNQEQHSSPSVQRHKRINHHHNNKSMPDNKRARLPCAGIDGVVTHKGKSKHSNRQCQWQACTDCCQSQRDATGSKCHTHKSGERAKNVIPNTQPFLNTVIETAETSNIGLTPATNNHDSNSSSQINDANLLGPAPPLHPLVLSPSTMRMYHLNRSNEEEAKRAVEEADARCDKNISISLWLKSYKRLLQAEDDPIPFMFASKSMKQFAISKCEALMIFLKTYDPHWNKLLRVYDARSDRWNFTLVETSIPMLNPLREALVCLSTVDPKLCQGLPPLQARLSPAVRSNIRATVDSLRATPIQTPNNNRIYTIQSSSGSATSSSSSYGSNNSPMPVASKHRKTPPNADEPTPLLSITIHHGANTVEEPEIEVVAVRGPKFSCNIFNEPPSPTPIPPVSKIISPSTGDVVAANEDISFSSSPPSISEHPALRDSAPAASNQPHIPTAEAVTSAPGPVTKRRTETTVAIQRHSHANYAAMVFKTQGHAREVTPEKWEEFLKHCDRHNVAATFGTAKSPIWFAKQLGEAR
ncbi:uncharacterized protein MELLADRAFT_88262 [Melampsora larici-populina 98AG31]|uniref:Uncharacterized protein n=1 Tax=Melampsora larici-populina (strain 98AG31 / pathotype 3-4-7) TaxID=747676 RepID=F4RR62_MELLP|nr:uncharacterized protein MELLADRAFT_88262 [Melampsora larici-populina 98AG31]EGG05160.1 hypothetical protein MELLADRAFT_88262 [Melampsora larici-populina 98AG31]